MTKTARWEIEIIFEPTGESMTVYLGDEIFDDEEPMDEYQVIDTILADLSIVPRFLGYDEE